MNCLSATIIKKLIELNIDLLFEEIDCSGYYFPAERAIIINESLLNKPNVNFAVMHELGHLLNHHANDIALYNSSFNNRAKMEAQANFNAIDMLIDIYMDIYEKIRQLAQEKNISIRQLEEQTKIGNGVVGKWRTSTPGIDKVQKIADYFHVSVDYLLGRKEKVTSVDLSEDDVVFSFDGKEVSPEEIRAAIAVIKAARGE